MGEIKYGSGTINSSGTTIKQKIKINFIKWSLSAKKHFFDNFILVEEKSYFCRKLKKYNIWKIYDWY